MDKKIGAVVLAGGYSSRMGALKALLPYGGRTLVSHVLDNLKQAGVDPVILVTGFEDQKLRAAVTDESVQIVYNPNFDQGMFSSVTVGVQAMEQQDAEGFFLLPVDYPMISVTTLKAMMACLIRTGVPVVYPHYCGKKGHPPLIGRQCIKTILQEPNQDGLRGALKPYEKTAGYLSVDDPGILLDMDTPEDYQRHLAMLRGAQESSILLIQGEKGIGKTRLLKELLEPYKKRIGGFYQQRRAENGSRTGFILRSVQEDKLKNKAVCKAEQIFLYREGEVWKFQESVFDDWAAKLLRQEMDQGLPFFYLNEIGGMELNGDSFRGILYQMLASRMPCIGIFKHEQSAISQSESMDTGSAFFPRRRALVQELVRSGGRILTLTLDNEAEVRQEAAAFLERYLGAVPKKRRSG